ncbi:MAG: cysteine desulfurase family protein [Cyanobacteriota bacterium]|jgi:cysteine desulfurase
MIYLDYQATTPVDQRVVEKMIYYMTQRFGNASSVDHQYGEDALEAIKISRQQIADLINASNREIIFTSGATESINLAIQGHIAKQKKPVEIILSPVEHKAVLDTCQALAKQGRAEINWLKVDQFAQIDLEYLEKICSQKEALLCLMAANNEVGTIYPIDQIGEIAQRNNIPFFCDASQAVGKIPINFRDSGITYLAFSGHKIYGPKGIGALVIRKGATLEPLTYGGGQQRGIRPGTLDTPSIAGIGEACYLRLIEMEQDELEIARKRDLLQQALINAIPNLRINGNNLRINGNVESRLAGNLHCSIPGVPNDAIIARTYHQLAISTGSACSSGAPAPSHVLLAMGLSTELVESSLRISLGKFTTDDDIQKAVEILTAAVEQIIKLKF